MDQEKSSVMFTPKNLILYRDSLHSLAIYEHRSKVNSPFLPDVHHNLLCLPGVKDEIIGRAPGCQVPYFT